MSRGAPIQQIRRVTAITTAAYVELDSALNQQVSGITVMSSMDKDLEIAIGAAGSEVSVLYIVAGSTAPVFFSHPITLPKGARLAAKAFAADTTSGSLIINLWG